MPFSKLVASTWAAVMARSASSTAESKPKDLSITCTRRECIITWISSNPTVGKPHVCWCCTGMSLSIVFGIPATETLRPRRLISWNSLELWYQISKPRMLINLHTSTKLVPQKSQLLLSEFHLHQLCRPKRSSSRQCKRSNWLYYTKTTIKLKWFEKWNKKMFITWLIPLSWMLSTIFLVSWPPRDVPRMVPPRLWMSFTLFGVRGLVFLE